MARPIITQQKRSPRPNFESEIRRWNRSEHTLTRRARDSESSPIFNKKKLTRRANDERVHRGVVQLADGVPERSRGVNDACGRVMVGIEETCEMYQVVRN